MQLQTINSLAPPQQRTATHKAAANQNHQIVKSHVNSAGFTRLAMFQEPSVTAGVDIEGIARK